MKRKLIFREDGTGEWVDPKLAPIARVCRIDDGIHVSDIALCCLPEEVEARRADDKLHGFHVEYKPDQTSLDDDGSVNCLNAHIPKGELERYRKHHHLGDRNSKNGSGAMITADHLADAERMMRERFPTKERV